VTYGRGPEYRLKSQDLIVPERSGTTLDVRLERWIDPSAHGFFGGDHHIHAAGCAQLYGPNAGRQPEGYVLQVKGEGLNVGCVLTWGPCYDFQRRFFEPRPDGLSEPLTLIKYDVEVSGFGSQALGHVCLLNLRDQTYPGSEGTATKGWPTWTTPVLRWAKTQGRSRATPTPDRAWRSTRRPPLGAYSPPSTATRTVSLIPAEAARGFFPPIRAADADRDGVLTRSELEAAHEQAADTLPNFANPEMNGVGAMELWFRSPWARVTSSARWTRPGSPSGTCGINLLKLRLSVEGERRDRLPLHERLEGRPGRVYVRLGDVKTVNFDAWCAGLAAGRSYVSDGFAHPLEFTVGGKRPSEQLGLEKPGVSRCARRWRSPSARRSRWRTAA